MRITFISLPLLILAALAGCSPVNITEPTPQTSSSAITVLRDPLLRFAVQFQGNYAGGFIAELDGQDWTSRFAPAPMPSSGSIAPAPPVFGSGQHVLTANATCPLIICTNSTVTFLPPVLTFDPPPPKVTRGQRFPMVIKVQTPPSVPILVRLSPDPELSLAPQGKPPLGAGQTLTVAIPANLSGATFDVVANSSAGGGRLPKIAAEADGCDSTGVSIPVGS